MSNVYHSVLAEEFQTNKEAYEQAAKDHTAINACQSMESIEEVKHYSLLLIALLQTNVALRF